jgi:DNA-binding CsgD family transcriptional regulator
MVVGVSVALVERGTELSVLAGVAAGRRCAAVVGPAGIGKTALLAEAARIGRGAGGLVLTARGTEFERGLGFGIVRQLFEPVLARSTAEQRADLLGGAAAPATAALDGAGVDASAASWVGDFAVLHGLFWLTANLCRRRRVLLVIDDLHWADRGSLRYLAYLQPRLEGLALSVVAAARPHEPGTDEQLVDVIVLDASCTMIQPAPLTAAGAADMLRATLGRGPDAGFLTACQEATGGNPLLLRELARAIAEHGIAPTAANTGAVQRLAAPALATRVSARLARLPSDCAELATAVAVLGDGSPRHHAAVLAGCTPERAAQAAGQLADIDVLTQTDDASCHAPLLSFVHPLVRAAVYDHADPEHCIRQHAAAVRLLQQSGAEAERLASHLLRIPPATIPQAPAILRLAAAEATHRGAPDAALAYLRRCLTEPMNQHERLDVLTEAGAKAAVVDLPAAAAYLDEALRSTTDVDRRVDIAYRLSRVYLVLGRLDDVRTLCVEAMRWLAEDQVDMRRRLLTALFNAELISPDRTTVATLAVTLGELEAHPSLGGRMLDCLIALYLGLAGDPRAIQRARRGLQDDLVLELANGDTAIVGACETLLMADLDEAMTVLDAGVASAYRTGRTHALAWMILFRGVGWLWRGQLVEAAADLREAVRTTRATGEGSALGQLFVTSYLAKALVELGELAEAEAVLQAAGIPDPLPAFGLWFLPLDAKAQLLRAQGHHERALRAARGAGHFYDEVYQMSNPAQVAWRSEAALCLHSLGRVDQARRCVARELELARRWGAPRALGRALRVTGLVRGTDDGLPLLYEAVDVLEKSPARLEYAKALIDLGAALRRAGQRGEARRQLEDGMELAHRCGAAQLAAHAQAELRSTGARPRRPRASGPEALTPSERRVAELAAEGHSNRDIAQQLFVTIKTVEVHLSNTYRKLGITRRDQLARSLPRR